MQLTYTKHEFFKVVISFQFSTFVSLMQQLIIMIFDYVRCD